MRIFKIIFVIFFLFILILVYSFFKGTTKKGKVKEYKLPKDIYDFHIFEYHDDDDEIETLCRCQRQPESIKKRKRIVSRLNNNKRIRLITG